MKIISMNPAIRIRPPLALTNGQWVAEDFNDRKVYALPDLDGMSEGIMTSVGIFNL